VKVPNPAAARLEALNDISATIRGLEKLLSNQREKVTGEHYEIFAGCMENYIQILECSQLAIYQEAKAAHTHLGAMLDAIERAIGHLKEFDEHYGTDRCGDGDSAPVQGGVPAPTQVGQDRADSEV
jgi:hypothetical protein